MCSTAYGKGRGFFRFTFYSENQTMFCGTGSFSHVDNEPTTPKGSKKKKSKNPYSTRGLDKFSKVMSELEARRERIMARTGAQGVSMVRFMYSNSQDWVPIIVRLREDPPKPSKQVGKKAPDTKTLQPLPALPPPEPSEGPAEVVRGAEPASEKKMKKSFSWVDKESWRGWRPRFYWPMVMVVILLCLVMFGRVFAICCTSIWWYLVPIMKGDGERRDVKRSMKKKDYGRRMSDKRLGGGNLVVAPPSQAKRMGGVQELQSPRSHGHGKRG